MSINQYTLFGAEESPYSVKLRGYLSYKGLPFVWQSRNDNPELFAQHAKVPLIPLLVTPDQQGLQDSTPIIEGLEAEHSEPSVYPTDSVARFVNFVLEEFADEWGNKWMFHYRWAREVDQIACAQRLAKVNAPQAGVAELNALAEKIRERMTNRVWFVGSTRQTAHQIEASFKDFLELFDVHLSTRPYVFGQRPSFADFALWGQLYNCHRDPTPRRIIEIQAPNTLAWIQRMHQPINSGDFETWAELETTMVPILKDQVGGLFLPWSVANAQAIENGEEEFSVQLSTGQWRQKPQKYHARSLQMLRQKYAQVDTPATKRVMEQCGCLSALDVED